MRRFKDFYDKSSFSPLKYILTSVTTPPEASDFTLTELFSPAISCKRFCIFSRATPCVSSAELPAGFFSVLRL